MSGHSSNALKSRSGSQYFGGLYLYRTRLSPAGLLVLRLNDPLLPFSFTGGLEQSLTIAREILAASALIVFLSLRLALALLIAARSVPAEGDMLVMSLNE